VEEYYMKKIVAVSVFLFIGVCLSGQINKFGVPIIKNYSTQVTQGAEYNWSIVKDKSGVVYFGNDDKGLIRFDGNLWSTIPVRNEPIIRTLGVANNGVIYVGGAFEFGYVGPGKSGKMEYVSLSERFDKPVKDSMSVSSSIGSDSATQEEVNIGEIYSLAVTDSLVYFVGSESLFKYYIQKDSIDYINLRDQNFKQIIKISLIGERIILADNLRGLFELKNRKLEPLPGGDYFKRKICLVLLPINSNSIIVGTYSSGIFLYDYVSGIVTEDYVEKSLNTEFQSAQIYTGIASSSGQIILGTLSKGIFVLDKEGKLISKWNKETSDLQDNTITALYSGSNTDSELWISSAGFVSKAYVNVPFTEFSTKSGLDGIINNISEFDNKIYAATDIGLFRSYTNREGIRKFDKVSGIDDQVFCLYNAIVGNNNFLLAGTLQGLYEIKPGGKTLLVDDILIGLNEAKSSSFNVRSIFQSRLNPNRFYIGQNSTGLTILEYDGLHWKLIKNIKSISGYLTILKEKMNGDLFVFTGNPYGIYRLRLNDTIPELYNSSKGLPDVTLNSISEIGDDIVSSTGNGVYKYVSSTNSWIQYNEILKDYTKGLRCIEILKDPDGDIWFESIDSRINESLFSLNGDSIKKYSGSLNLLPNIYKLDFKYFDNKVWMAKSKSIYVIDKAGLTKENSLITPMFTKIVIGSDSVIMDQTFYSTLGDGKRVPSPIFQGSRIPEFTYNYNQVSFFWTTPYFIEEEATLYSYKLEGFDREWSRLEKKYYKDFTNLPYGHYKFMVKAKTITDLETVAVAYEFNILKPWYFTIGAFLLYSVLVMLLIFAIIKAYTRRLKNENIRLEGIVVERTAVVVKQKEELESSIHYASRIQRALLPSEQIFSSNIRNYFILFKPRDIVSGDFYWMTKKGDRLYIVAADCTGHGVPGAFMSLLGMSFLDEIIDKELAPRADEVLSELRLHVTESLKQVGGENEAKDGMDMGLIVIDFETAKVEFSGAYNPCFRVRKLTEEESKSYVNEDSDSADSSLTDGKYILETIMASKMPIGISSRMNEKFVFYEWPLEKGIAYYLFSDGYIDQFGGPHGRKFMKKSFKKIILDIQDYPMEKQKEILEQNLNDWMAKVPQVDDILVMGIKIE
jgi:serine phosphatase RsbU (regulator of sigma subunit)